MYIFFGRWALYLTRFSSSQRTPQEFATVHLASEVRGRHGRYLECPPRSLNCTLATRSLRNKVSASWCASSRFM